MSLLLFLMLFCNLFAFKYDRALRKAQNGDWPSAIDDLTTMLVHDPDNPDFLYDLAVSCYKVGDTQKAIAYFQRLLMLPNLDDVLRERAEFNLANAYVQEQKLHDALAHYESVLSYSPKNEYAQHNYDKVKEMLEQEKQQQDDDQSQDDQQQQDQDNQSDSAEASSDASQDESSSDEQSGDDDASQESSPEKQQEQQVQQSQKSQQEDDDEYNPFEQQFDQQEDSADGASQTQEQEAEAAEQEDVFDEQSSDDADEQSDSAEASSDVPQGDEHDEQQAGVGQEVSLVEDDQLDQRIAQVLESQAEYDKKLNKQLLYMRSHTADSTGDNGYDW